MRTPSALRAMPMWVKFLAVEAVLALIYFPFGIPSGKGRILGLIPWMEWAGQVPAWSLLGMCSVAAIAYGAYRHRPRTPAAWWFIGLGVLLFITGDTIYKSWHQLMGQQNIPFPSFIDAIYITMYPVLAIGLLLLARSRTPGGDETSLVDALMVTLALGLLSWIFLIGPNVMAPGGLLVRLTAAAYPLGDVLVLAMLAHLWTAGGLHNTAGRLLTVGTVGTLVADTVYGLAGLHPSFNWHDGNPFDLGWIAFYSCWGAAALHPSMRELSERRATAPPLTSRSRLAVLGCVSLVGPVALVVEDLRGSLRDAGAIAGASAAMFVLVVARMSMAVRAHGRAMSREQILRRLVAQLVGAPNRAGIYDVVMGAVGELTAGDASVSARLAVPAGPGGMQVVATAGAAPSRGRVDLSAYPPGAGARLRDGHLALWHSSEAPDRHGPQRHLLVCPIATGGDIKALIEVSSQDDLGTEVAVALETLSDQVGLALDRDSLTEAAHARRSEARFQTLVQNASDVILIVRPDTTITYQTPSAQRTLGYAPGALEGTAFTGLLGPHDLGRALTAYAGVASRTGSSATAEWRVKHNDGSWRDMEVAVNNLLAEPTVEGIVLTLRDVTAQKKLENELKHQAFHDALTALANRALFRDRLEHALARSARSLSSLAVLFLDLDDFKLVNDTLGHAAGDDLLVEVARRLLASLRTGDTAARFGGDEFAVLLEETQGPEDANHAAERILEGLRPPFQLKDRQVSVHASIGIAYSKLGTEDPAELLQAADVAMYAAKARGKNSYQLYEPALQAA
ncbi:MAG TPA: diguanylate cyclase, partial [Acidimicrobiales bacterium]|nr:diguanylate cyclase [Acidimicrobiales bacterium]